MHLWLFLDLLFNSLFSNKLIHGQIFYKPVELLINVSHCFSLLGGCKWGNVDPWYVFVP